MDSLIYIGSLIVIVAVAFTLYRSNNTKLMLLVLAIGGYILYSHNTGHTATEFKDKVIHSIDNSAEDFVGKYKNDIDTHQKEKEELNK